MTSRFRGFVDKTKEINNMVKAKAGQSKNKKVDRMDKLNLLATKLRLEQANQMQSKYYTHICDKLRSLSEVECQSSI